MAERSSANVGGSSGLSEVGTLVALWSNHTEHAETVDQVREAWPELADCLDGLVCSQLQ